MKPFAAPAGQRTAGWTLIELVMVMTLIAFLASMSYPSFKAIVLRIHRGDALTTLAQVHLQQQRHRSNHPSFATLSELGIAATSPGGRYRLHEQPPSASRFVVMASAVGTQAADLPCNYLLLEVVGTDTRQASGPDDEVGNGDGENRRCWGN